MHKMLFVLLTLLLATFAAGQTAAPLSSTYQPANHAETASHQSLQSEQSLVSDTVTTASGEMPIGDIPLPAMHEEPLGNVARRYRQMPKEVQAMSAAAVLKRSAVAYPGWYLPE